MNLLDMLTKKIGEDELNPRQMSYQNVQYRAAPEAKVKNWSPEKEKEFLDYIKNHEWYKSIQRDYGETPNLDEQSYNLRAAYERGIEPEIYPYDNRYHWPSSAMDTSGRAESLKAFNHPTAWMEDYMNLTGGRDPHEGYQLTPLQARNLSDLLKERYGK